MPSKSIHKPACTENHPAHTPFPTSGDNFTTVLRLDDQADTLAMLEAMEFLDDYAAALATFETELKRTGTA